MKPGWWDRPSLCVACRASPFLRPADRRQKAIVCPTGHGAESMSCGWVSGERSCHVGVVVERVGKPWHAPCMQRPGWWDRPSLCVACRASPFCDQPTDDKKRSSVPPGTAQNQRVAGGFPQSPCHDGGVVERVGKPGHASCMQRPGWWDRPSLCVACRASPFCDQPTDDKKRSSVPPGTAQNQRVAG